MLKRLHVSIILWLLAFVCVSMTYKVYNLAHLIQRSSVEGYIITLHSLTDTNSYDTVYKTLTRPVRENGCIKLYCPLKGNVYLEYSGTYSVHSVSFDGNLDVVGSNK